MADWRTANNSLRAARDSLNDIKRREHVTADEVGTFRRLGSIRLPAVDALIRKGDQQMATQRQAVLAGHN